MNLNLNSLKKISDIEKLSLKEFNELEHIINLYLKKQPGPMDSLTPKQQKQLHQNFVDYCESTQFEEEFVSDDLDLFSDITANKLKFSNTNQALQYLANYTNKKIKIVN